MLFYRALDGLIAVINLTGIEQEACEVINTFYHLIPPGHTFTPIEMLYAIIEVYGEFDPDPRINHHLAYLRQHISKEASGSQPEASSNPNYPKKGIR